MSDPRPGAVEPLVSVVVLGCGQRDRLAVAVRSVLRQTYQPCEIVVLDDTGLDATTDELLASSGAATVWSGSPSQGSPSGGSGDCSQARIVRRQLSGGPGAVRNQAIRHCRGELIALLEAGDEWLPEMLEKCVQRLQRCTWEDIVYAHLVRGDQRLIPEARAIEALPAGWMFHELFEGTAPLDSSVVFRRRVWERIGGFDESLPVCVGYNFWLRASLGHRFGVIPEPLVVPSRVGAGREPQTLLRELSTRARVLYECYELKGGIDRVDRRRAGRVIARAFRQAGWLALRMGHGTVAEVAFAIAAGYAPSMSSRVLLLLGSAQRRWNRQPMYTVKSDTLTFLR